jgi:hypothetical protein
MVSVHDSTQALSSRLNTVHTDTFALTATQRQLRVHAEEKYLHSNVYGYYFVGTHCNMKHNDK